MSWQGKSGHTGPELMLGIGRILKAVEAERTHGVKEDPQGLISKAKVRGS